jgi:glycosyltransferase involved in cell wall biosynthesis
LAFLLLYLCLAGMPISLYLSRIHPKKGLDLLIEAFASIATSDSRLQLVIVGPDQIGWQASLQARAVELGIADRLSWAGMLIGDIKWGVLRHSLFFCLPSHQENFGVVVAKALACGLRVSIAEPVTISADVFAFGAGLVHANNVAGTTYALQQWLALSRDKKLLMGQRRGVKLFTKRFDFASVAKNLLPLISDSLR